LLVNRRGVAYNSLVANEPSRGRLVPTDELRAAMDARRELGRDYEDELVEAFADRLERRIQDRIDTRARAPRKGPDSTIAFVSLGVAIPLLGIAGGTAGLPGIVVVCVALVLVNAIYARA
jgi:hypothetical protein